MEARPLAHQLTDRPGIGQLIIKAIFDRDYPIIQGVTLAIGVMVLFINLITDISYAILDPRLSYS